MTNTTASGPPCNSQPCAISERFSTIQWRCPPQWCRRLRTNWTSLTSTLCRPYQAGKQRWEPVAQIRNHFGYADITEPLVGFRLTRWLYILCWSGTERPSVLFKRATTWLLAHKILLPGRSTLERFVVRLCSRVETRVWRLLGRGTATSQQQAHLEYLLTVPEGSRGSLLDRLRSGPTRVSDPSLRAAIDRLKSVRELGIALWSAQRIPESEGVKRIV